MTILICSYVVATNNIFFGSDFSTHTLFKNLRNSYFLLQKHSNLKTLWSAVHFICIYRQKCPHAGLVVGSGIVIAMQITSVCKFC